MKFRPLALVIALPLALCALPLRSRADEPAPKTYKVLLRNRWKADVVASFTSTEHRVMAIIKVVGGKPSETPEDSFKEDRAVDQEVVVKCLEANAEGYPTRSLLYFTKFAYAVKAEAGLEKDASLEHVHVEVSGVGAARTVKVLTPDAKVSEKAMGWLDEEYGKGDKTDALLAVLEPADAQAAGASWKPSVADVAKVLSSEGATADAEKMAVDVTLAGVEGEKAEYRVVFVPALKGFPAGPGAPLPWKSGGTGKVSVHYVRGLAADSLDSSVEKEDEFEGIADAKDSEIHFALKASTEMVWARGGTMPELAKHK